MSGYTFNRFEGTIGTFRFSDNGCNGDSKESNVSDRVHISDKLKNLALNWLLIAFYSVLLRAIK